MYLLHNFLPSLEQVERPGGLGYEATLPIQHQPKPLPDVLVRHLDALESLSPVDSPAKQGSVEPMDSGLGASPLRFLRRRRKSKTGGTLDPNDQVQALLRDNPPVRPTHVDVVRSMRDVTILLVGPFRLGLIKFLFAFHGFSPMASDTLCLHVLMFVRV
jgi:hypothetical protein